MDDITVRSPTKDNYLRQETKGYLTEKAAAFLEAYKAGHYQAAAYIKDCADAIYVYARQVGILTEADENWYFGKEGADPLFHPGQESRCREKADGELVENEVMRRFNNLVTYLKNEFNRSMPQNENVHANAVLNITAEKMRKAASCG